MSAKIAGLDRALKGLSGAERTFRNGLERKANRIVAPARKAAATYPPKRQGQRYRRTNRLKRGWTQGIANVQSRAGRVDITLPNVVEYTPEVQEEQEQKPVFRDRWVTLETIGQQQQAATAVVVDQVNIESSRGVF